MKKFTTSKEETLKLLTGKFVTVTNDMFFISGILKFEDNWQCFVQTLDTYGDVEFNINDIENIAESTEENPPIIERYLIVLRS
jgi:hypothetical protein